MATEQNSVNVVIADYTKTLLNTDDDIHVIVGDNEKSILSESDITSISEIYQGTINTSEFLKKSSMLSEFDTEDAKKNARENLGIAAIVSSDANNSITVGSDGGAYAQINELTVDPLAYYILAKS